MKKFSETHPSLAVHRRLSKKLVQLTTYDRVKVKQVIIESKKILNRWEGKMIRKAAVERLLDSIEDKLFVRSESW